MSETMSAVIRIGGRIPSRVVPALCQIICDEGVALEWGAVPFTPGSAVDLLRARTEDEGQLVLALYDEQARWGQFDDFEQFLREHRIAFNRQSDSKYEYDAQLLRFRPGRKPVVTITSASGQPVVAASYLDPVRQMVAQATEQFDADAVQRGVNLVRRVQRWLKTRMPPEVPPLTSFEIVGGTPSARKEIGGSAGVG